MLIMAEFHFGANITGDTCAFPSVGQNITYTVLIYQYLFLHFVQLMLMKACTTQDYCMLLRLPFKYFFFYTVITLFLSTLEGRILLIMRTSETVHHYQQNLLLNFGNKVVTLILCHQCTLLISPFTSIIFLSHSGVGK